MAPPLPTVTFRAGSQGTKVVAMTAFSAACAAGAAWWGLEVARSYGLAEADGGLLRPLWQRLALGGGLAGLGLAFLAGMLAYLRFYVVRLDMQDEGRTVRVDRFFPYPALRLPARDVRVGREIHSGDVGELGLVFPRLSAVDAPWLSLHVRGWRWPLLLDLRGRFEA